MFHFTFVKNILEKCTSFLIYYKIIGKEIVISCKDNHYKIVRNFSMYRGAKSRENIYMMANVNE